MPEQTPQHDALEEIGFGKAFAEELCQRLESSFLFRDFSRKEIEILARYMHAYRAPKGTVLYREGERNSFLSLITHGKLDILKADQGEQGRKIATIRSGSVIGEISLIDDFPHSASAIMTEDAELLTLTKANLQRITEDYPLLGNKILWRIAWQLCARLRQTSGVLVDHLSG